MRIEVKNQLSLDIQEIYTFNLFDLSAVFISYRKEQKIGRKFKLVELWDNYTRNNDVYSIKEPILPAFIRSIAVSEVSKHIRIKTWDEYKNK